MTASPTPDSGPIPASGPSTTAGSAQELPPTLFRLKNLHTTSPPVTSPPVTEQSIQSALTHQAISAQRQDPQRQDVSVAQPIRDGSPLQGIVDSGSLTDDDVASEWQVRFDPAQEAVQGPQRQNAAGQNDAETVAAVLVPEKADRKRDDGIQRQPVTKRLGTKRPGTKALVLAVLIVLVMVTYFSGNRENRSATGQPSDVAIQDAATAATKETASRDVTAQLPAASGPVGGQSDSPGRANDQIEADDVANQEPAWQVAQGSRQDSFDTESISSALAKYDASESQTFTTKRPANDLDGHGGQTSRSTSGVGVTGTDHPTATRALVYQPGPVNAVQQNQPAASVAGDDANSQSAAAELSQPTTRTSSATPNPIVDWAKYLPPPVLQAEQASMQSMPPIASASAPSMGFDGSVTPAAAASEPTVQTAGGLTQSATPNDPLAAYRNYLPENDAVSDANYQSAESSSAGPSSPGTVQPASGYAVPRTAANPYATPAATRR